VPIELNQGHTDFQSVSQLSYGTFGFDCGAKVIKNNFRQSSEKKLINICALLNKGINLKV
jgi:hypothetical protein